MVVGFKKTDIGVIPLDWEIEPYTQIASLKHGFQFLENHFSKMGIGVVKIGNLKDGSGINFDNLTFVPFDSLKKFERFKLKKGDVLMALTGATLGKVCKVDTDILLLQNYRVGNFIPNERTIRDYIYHICQSEIVQKAVKDLVNSGAQPNLGKRDFDKILIPLPPTKAEQTAIATALNDADALITQLDKLIAKKKAIKQGAMQELLKPKVDWETKTLGDVSKFRRGSFPQPYGLDKWYDDNTGFPFIQVYDVDHNMKLKPDTKRHISEEAQKMSVFVEKGSILLTIQGSIGRIAMTQYDAYVDRTLLLFESYKIPFNKYFFMLLVYVLFEQEKQNAPGGTIKTITKQVLANFNISYPNIEEQNRIAEILSDMDLEILKLEVKLEKQKQLKQGMMQSLLTGKIRLV